MNQEDIDKLAAAANESRDTLISLGEAVAFDGEDFEVLRRRCLEAAAAGAALRDDLTRLCESGRITIHKGVIVFPPDILTGAALRDDLTRIIRNPDGNPSEAPPLTAQAVIGTIEAMRTRVDEPGRTETLTELADLGMQKAIEQIRVELGLRDGPEATVAPPQSPDQSAPATSDPSQP